MPRAPPVLLCDDSASILESSCTERPVPATGLGHAIEGRKDMRYCTYSLLTMVSFVAALCVGGEKASGSTAELAPAPGPKIEERITIDFAAGSARLSNIAKAELDEVALKMQQAPALRAQVIGYAAGGSSAEADRDLSRRRAEAVRNYLVMRHDIDGNRIIADGRGRADSTGNADEGNRAIMILTGQ
jgi:hypothetical protein